MTKAGPTVGSGMILGIAIASILAAGIGAGAGWSLSKRIQARAGNAVASAQVVATSQATEPNSASDKAEGAQATLPLMLPLSMWHR
jgi:hypothetical protein